MLCLSNAPLRRVQCENSKLKSSVRRYSILSIFIALNWFFFRALDLNRLHYFYMNTTLNCSLIVFIYVHPSTLFIHLNCVCCSISLWKQNWRHKLHYRYHVVLFNCVAKSKVKTIQLVECSTRRKKNFIVSRIRVFIKNFKSHQSQVDGDHF